MGSGHPRRQSPLVPVQPLRHLPQPPDFLDRNSSAGPSCYSGPALATHPAAMTDGTGKAMVQVGLKELGTGIIFLSIKQVSGQNEFH